MGISQVDYERMEIEHQNCGRDAPQTHPEQNVTYTDLRPGDLIKVRIDAPMFPQIDGEWERREVVAVDPGGREDEPQLIVRFRDPSDGREYNIVANDDRHRHMRRCSSNATSSANAEHCDCPAPVRTGLNVDQCDGCGREACQRHRPLTGSCPVCYAPAGEQCHSAVTHPERRSTAEQSESRVYVDQFPSGWGRWTGGGHMLANDIDALHAMAAQIGLKRQWFQGDKTFAHYDVVASKRRLAVAAGAIEIEFGELPDDVLMLNRADGTYERRSDRLARREAPRS